MFRGLIARFSRDYWQQRKLSESVLPALAGAIYKERSDVPNRRERSSLQGRTLSPFSTGKRD